MPVFSIESGSGFTGDFQRYSCVDIYDNYIHIWNTGYTFQLNRGYNLSFKYRSNFPIYCYSVGGNWFSNDIPDNSPNDAELVIVTGITIIADYKFYNIPTYLGFSSQDGYVPSPGDYLDLDEINLFLNQKPNYPVCTTLPASNITSTTAYINGLVNPYGLDTYVYIETGFTTNYSGSIELDPIIIIPCTGDYETSVNFYLTNLTPSTEYHYRIKCVNSIGTNYGYDYYFSTLT